MKVFEIFKKKQVAQSTPVEVVAVYRVHHNQIIEAITDGECFPVVIVKIVEDDFFTSSWQVPEVYTESITAHAHRFFFQVRSLTDEVWTITGEQLLMWTRPVGAVWA